MKHFLNLVVMGLVVLLSLGSCAFKTSYKNVRVQELRAESEPNRIVLDVREPEEYASGHPPGARLLPLGEVSSQAAELPKYVPLYVICHSGNRSKQASETLSQLGFKDIRNPGRDFGLAGRRLPARALKRRVRYTGGQLWIPFPIPV